MYHPVKIAKLSEHQLNRLRNGHPVRVKMGSHHTIHLSVPQIKKLHTAHKHGKASTITLDPYQIKTHGSGLFSDAYKFVKRTPFLREPINQAIKKGKHYAHTGIDYLSRKAHKKIDDLPLIQGEGLFGGVLSGAAGLSNLIGGPGSDEASKVLGTIGGIANTFGLGMKKHKTKKGKGVMKDLAMNSLYHSITGMGNRKRRTKKGKGVMKDLAMHSIFNSVTGMGKRKRRTKKGKGVFQDVAKDALKSVAKKGLELGTNYLQDKINGLGVKQKRRATAKQLQNLAKARYIKAQKHGGALYVA